jgi:uncharacterized protein
MAATFQNNLDISAWCLSTGASGSEVICISLVEHLGITPIVKRVKPNNIMKLLAPLGQAKLPNYISPPWPDLVVASGRRVIPFARMIKKLSKGKTFVAVLLKPSISAPWIDFIWTPLHDNINGENVVSTLTPPNLITQEKLIFHNQSRRHIVDGLTSPLVTVLIGGPSKSFPFEDMEVENLAQDLLFLHAKTGCSFLVTPSYRTKKKHIARIKERLEGIPAIVWNFDGENPYLSYLALADYFIVTCDSVNMISEAASTGRPIYTYRLSGGSKKFKGFYQALLQKGVVRWFDGLLESWSYTPINATSEIAQRLKERFFNFNSISYQKSVDSRLLYNEN